MYQLKLKAMSLAAEARVIKADEQREKRLVAKWKARAAIGREKARQRGQVVDPSPPQVSSRTLTGAHLHRVNDVRKEARCALLAYGFLRGNSYREMENFAWTQPNWERIQKLAERYAGVDVQIIAQRFAQWQDEALGGVKASWCETLQPGSVRDIVEGPFLNNKDWVLMQSDRNGPHTIEEVAASA